MALRQIFDMDSVDFITALERNFPDYLSAEMAELLDEMDPLNFTKNLYDVGELIPFAGHSLGPAFKKIAVKVEEMIKLQRQLHAGIFKESHPEGKDNANWFQCDEHHPSNKAAKQLLGFKEPEEFCLRPNGLSDNLGMLMDTFYRPGKNDWLTGRTKIIILETEFVSDQALASSVIKRAIQTAKDFEVLAEDAEIKAQDEIIKIKANALGLYSTEEIIAVITQFAEQTQMICFSDIVFCTGQRLQLDKIFAATAEIIQANKIRVILDLAHTIGNRPINLESMPITAAVGCSYKHLSGTAGSAWGIYVNRNADLQKYKPIQGWKVCNLEKIFARINQFDDDMIENKRGARAFRTSNPTPISLMPALTILTELGEIGFARLFKKSEQLTQYLIAQLKYRFGDEVVFVTPLDPAQRGAMICLQFKSSVNVKHFEDEMKAAGYEIDTRPPHIIRVTAHYGYTTFAGIEKFIKACERTFNHLLYCMADDAVDNEDVTVTRKKPATSRVMSPAHMRDKNTNQFFKLHHVLCGERSIDSTARLNVCNKMKR